MKKLVAQLQPIDQMLPSQAQPEKFYGVEVASNKPDFYNGRGFVTTKSFASSYDGYTEDYVVRSFRELTIGNSWTHLSRKSTLTDYLAYLLEKGNNVFEFDSAAKLAAWAAEYGR